MANRFRLTPQLSETDKIDHALKDYYKSWRELNQRSKASFTALDNSFFTKKILKDLEPGPLKLYLYFAHAASNEHGHSWHSISTIADYFKAQTRTIDNWIKVLTDKDLIYRAQKGQKTHNTYIIPFSDTLIYHPAPKKRIEDDQGLLDDLLAKLEDLNFLYGEIIKVHHLFQWTIQRGKPLNRNYSVQMLLIITRRNNGVLIGHIHILRKSEHLSVNELDIEERCIFNSPFFFNGSTVTGIALTPNPPLRSRGAIRDIIDLIVELTEIEDWQLKDRYELEYGIKDDVLPVTDGEDTEIDPKENEDDSENEVEENVDE